jgi:acetoin utilization protein AcuC
MGCSVLLVGSPEATAYDLGDGHPMRAIRGELTTRLATGLGVLDRPSWSRRDAAPARDDELLLVHNDAYLAVVRAAERIAPGILSHFGLGTEDTPVIPGLHEAAAGVAGATLAACTAVWSGEFTHAVNLAGGLHHAMPAHASGFCVYNDAAVGIADLLRAGCARVAYVDLDAHHGDGVEAIFAADPRVLTISLHQDGRTLFPGSGAATDVGAPGAEGRAVNIALPPGTTDGGWLRALTAVVPVLRSFGPEVMVTQCGCDAHRRDPLSDLALTVEGFTVAYQLLHQLAHELCDGRWVVIGGGGYDLGSAVPRAWTQLLAVCSGDALAADTELPARWREDSTTITGAPAPDVLGDIDSAVTWSPWEAGHGDAHDPLDRAVTETRKAVFPLYGMDPDTAR